MTKPLIVLSGVVVVACLLLGGVAVVQVQAVAPPRQAAGASEADTSTQRALLDRYCVTCHNRTRRTAGLQLDAIDITNIGASAPVWEKVARKLRAGVMPPAGQSRPDRRAYDSFVSWLEAALDRAAAASPDPGRTEPVHRLNRTEYQNAIRDLLAFDIAIDGASLLPADDASYGFDNVAGVLRMSPTLLERYLSAAQKISREAIGSAPTSPSAETFYVSGDLSQERHIEGLPFGTRGGTLVQWTFPQDAEYVIKARLTRDTQDYLPQYSETHQLEITVDGERVQLFTLPGEPDEVGTTRVRYGGELSEQRIARDRRREQLDASLKVRVPVEAGPRKIGVAFLEKPLGLVETVRASPFSRSKLLLRQPFLRPYAGGFGNEEGRFQPYLLSVTITGPFNPRGPGDTPSRRRIFSCRPARVSDEESCASEILATLARRAYRRPVTDEDVEVLLAFYHTRRIDQEFEAGIELALQRLLMSPDFLFRIEQEPAGIAPNTPYRVSDLDLASRLSFLIWSSMPDDELLDVAARGALTDPTVLEHHMRRMLADDRAQALVSNFAGQWLYLRNLPAIVPNADLFPNFDENLRHSFRRETELFFDSIIREDRSVVDLLTADYTFVDERLGRHYGIPNVQGSHFRRVTLTDDRRRGLLGHGSILTATSHPNRTSPVVRGKWILENLLGTPPPAPPPDVPALRETNRDGTVLSMRERMIQHRANPACATCHALMDPLGFALENFDAVGQWRDRGESFTAIDSSGVLPDGTPFEGAAGLRHSLVANPELFVRTLTEKLLVYALGRGLESYDAPTVRAITREAARDDYRFSAIVKGVVFSVPFQMRRSAS